MAFTFLISLTCHSLHSQTFPALWPFCVTLSKHHLNCAFDTAWRAFKMPSRWWRRCGGGGGDGVLREAVSWLVLEMWVKCRFPCLNSTVYLEELLRCERLLLSSPGSSRLSSCSVHGKHLTLTPPLFGLSPLGLCPVSHLLHKLAQIRKHACSNETLNQARGGCSSQRDGCLESLKLQLIANAGAARSSVGV